MRDSRGKVFANVMSLSLGRGGRVTQSRVPDIGFHEIRGEDGEGGCLAKDCNLIFLGIKSSVIHKHKIHSVIKDYSMGSYWGKDHFVPILDKTRNKGWLGSHPNNQIVIIRGKTYMTGAKPGVRSWQSSAAPAMSSSPRPSGCGTAPDSEDGFGFLVI